MMVPVLFFCSGATALVYEVIWSKYLSLMFGSTVYAQSVVLAVFMGGLALGNRLFGRFGDTAAKPLAIYGRLEVAIGIYAFFFSVLFEVADHIFVRLGAPLLDMPMLLLALKGVFSVALLLGPTVLMGGTLPILAAWLTRSQADARRSSARFYSINTLGAFTGAWLAGFYLVRNWGLVASLQMTAMANLLIGLTAILLDRSGTARRSPAREVSPNSASSGPAEGLGLACVLVTVTGAVSMGLEVLAARSLGLIFGASLQAFAIMLMAFILGIGLGSAVVASPRLPAIPRDRLVTGLLLAAATWVGVLIWGIEEWVDVYRRLKIGLALNDMGYNFHQIVAGLFSVVLLGVPAAMLGAVLPLCIRRSQSNGQLASQVGRLLTWNTCGAVGGVLVTGFMVMPGIGLRASFGVAACALAIAALLLAIRSRHYQTAVLALVVLGSLGALLWLGGENWRNVMSSGAFRLRETEYTPQALQMRMKLVKVVFYEDAADATVSVEESAGRGSTPDLGLRVNGKVDASNRGDLATQYLLAHLPLMMRPEAEDVFVLGLGSGITAGALLGHPVRQVVVAENCEPVLRASKFFAPWNRDITRQPQVRIRLEDGRTVLKLSPQLYDVIISEPSNPWTAGVGSVFSEEFYEVAASRLKPGGLMVQWFHLYEMSDPLVAMILRTFSRTFPYFEIWDVATGDIVILGSKEAWPSGPAVYQRIFERPEPREELARIGLHGPEQIWARQLASQPVAAIIPGPGRTQSDGFPILEYDAPRAFYMGARAQEIAYLDERTWQMDLASPDKARALSSLTPEQLQQVFEDHGAANQQLDRHVRSRFPGAEARATDVHFGFRLMPSIFRPGPPDLSKAPAKAAPELVRLIEWDNALRTGTADWAEAAKEIPDALRAYQRARKPGEWPTAFLAHDLAKPFLASRRFAEAEQIIKAGLETEATDARLLFLSRWLNAQNLASSNSPTP
jgi:spermidine synthase